MTATEIVIGLLKLAYNTGLGQQGEMPPVMEEAEAFLKGKHMTFDEYQHHAAASAIYPPGLKVLYPALGLGGETGETLEKIKKVFRDNDGKPTPEQVRQIILELGDVLWYVAALASDLGYQLDAVAEMNVNKLTERKLTGKLQGSGDNR